jgi:hypothetical protein
MVLIDSIIAIGEEEETVEEQDHGSESILNPESEQNLDPTTASPIDPLSQFPHLNDLAVAEDAPINKKHEAWIPIDSDPNVPIVRKHKSTILADCTNPLDSKDWLKQV